MSAIGFQKKNGSMTTAFQQLTELQQMKTLALKSDLYKTAKEFAPNKTLTPVAKSWGIGFQETAVVNLDLGGLYFGKFQMHHSQQAVANGDNSNKRSVCRLRNDFEIVAQTQMVVHGNDILSWQTCVSEHFGFATSLELSTVPDDNIPQHSVVLSFLGYKVDDIELVDNYLISAFISSGVEPAGNLYYGAGIKFTIGSYIYDFLNNSIVSQNEDLEASQMVNVSNNSELDIFILKDLANQTFITRIPKASNLDLFTVGSSPSPTGSVGCIAQGIEATKDIYAWYTYVAGDYKFAMQTNTVYLDNLLTYVLYRGNPDLNWYLNIFDEFNVLLSSTLFNPVGYGVDIRGSLPAIGTVTFTSNQLI